MQDLRLSVGGIDADIFLGRIDDPDEACAGSEPFADFFQDFAGGIGGGEDFDCEVGCAVARIFSAYPSAGMRSVRTNAQSGARTVSGLRAIKKPVSAPSPTPKLFLLIKDPKEPQC